MGRKKSVERKIMALQVFSAFSTIISGIITSFSVMGRTIYLSVPVVEKSILGSGESYMTTYNVSQIMYFVFPISLLILIYILYSKRR